MLKKVFGFQKKYFKNDTIYNANIKMKKNMKLNL
jgi:hypothetical protein